LARKGWHQRPHHRISKKGLRFPAGQGKYKYHPPRVQFIPSSPSFRKPPNLGEKIVELIKNNPELAKELLGRIALWGGCSLAPTVCPILESVYLMYKGSQTVFKINELDIQSGDFKLFQTIFNRGVTKEKVKGNSPQTINMLARKAEYAHHIMSELQEMGIPSEKEVIIKNSLLSVSLKIDYEGLLTDDELSEHSLRITPSLIINKKRLLNTFANTLRDSEPSLYKELLLQIAKNGTDELF